MRCTTWTRPARQGHEFGARWSLRHKKTDSDVGSASQRPTQPGFFHRASWSRVSRGAQQRSAKQAAGNLEDLRAQFSKHKVRGLDTTAELTHAKQQTSQARLGYLFSALPLTAGSVLVRALSERAPAKIAEHIEHLKPNIGAMSGYSDPFRRLHRTSSDSSDDLCLRSLARRKLASCSSLHSSFHSRMPATPNPIMSVSKFYAPRHGSTRSKHGPTAQPLSPGFCTKGEQVEARWRRRRRGALDALQDTSQHR